MPQEIQRTTCGNLIERQRRKSFQHRIIQWRKMDLLWQPEAEALMNKSKWDAKDQKGILHYKLLQLGETVTATRYKKQLINLSQEVARRRSAWPTRYKCPRLLYDSARPHFLIFVKEALEGVRSMAHGLAEKNSIKREDIQKWLDEWSPRKIPIFYEGILKLPINWNDVVVNNGDYN